MSSTRMMQIWLGASAGGGWCGDRCVVRTRADALLARGARASSSASAPEASLKYTHSWAIRVATDASSSGGLSITAGWLPRLPSRRTRSAEAAVVHGVREVEVLLSFLFFICSVHRGPPPYTISTFLLSALS